MRGDNHPARRVAGSGRCSVAVGAGRHLGATAAASPTKVRVGTRSAFLRRARLAQRWRAMLWWEYADAALVIIECGDLTAPREVLPKLEAAWHLQ